jgi:hypothetical protein
MGETRPTKVGFWRKCYLCILCVTNPKAFEGHQSRYNSVVSQSSVSTGRRLPGVVVCRAFWFSFLLVALSVATGCAVGIVIRELDLRRSQRLPQALQIIGSFLLIWATLFVRGWEIQTICGVTLAERVNQWTYRTLYCVGTALLAFSFAMA